MENVLVIVCNAIALIFLLWLCSRLITVITDLIRPRYVKSRKFKKMVNDGNLLKLTAQEGLTIKCRYASNAQMFLENDGV